jgi:hypothetical protein
MDRAVSSLLDLTLMSSLMDRAVSSLLDLVLHVQSIWSRRL